MSNQSVMPVVEKIDAERFKTLVRSLLRLSAQADDDAIHSALAARGNSEVEWYSTRLKAIAEHNMARRPRFGDEVD